MTGSLTTKPVLTESYRAQEVSQLKHWAAFFFFVFIALSVSAYSLVLSPYPCCDEGGYINMLNAFFTTGKMDLMQWSQPTFIGVVPFAAPMNLIGQFGWYSYCGLAASFLTMAGLFAITSRYTNHYNALLLSLSPLCQQDFVSTTPTIMSDQFFLAYFVWSFVWLDRYCEVKSGKSLLYSSLAFALSAATRANGYLLLIGALVLCMRFKNRQSKMIAIALSVAAASTLMVVSLLVTNRIPLEQSSALPDIIFRHDFALFDLRATFKALFETLFALTPALILAADWKRVNRTDVGAAALSFLICFNFCLKNVLNSPVPATIWLTVLWIPALVALLSCTIRSAHNKQYLFSLCCLVSLGSFMIMPIMPHPLTRHAMPALIAMLITLAVGGTLKRGRLRYLAAAGAGLILITSNYATDIAARMENKMRWQVGSTAISAGINERDLFIDWGWFCAHDLIPGKIDNYDYRSIYQARERSSKFTIQEGQLKLRTPSAYGSPPTIP